MLNYQHEELSVRLQCDLLSLNRSGLYKKKQPPVVEEVMLMNLIRDRWLQYPFYGYRRIAPLLRSEGVRVNRKRVQRLMQVMGIWAIPIPPKTSIGNKLHKKYPNALKGLAIERPNQAWQVDITYLRLPKGFAYLVAFIDVYSRHIVNWRLSTTLSADFCIEMLSESLSNSACLPEIIHSDQGSQFTSNDWTDMLSAHNITISMTGKGRCLDNIYVERFWRSLKYEDIYLNDYQSIEELQVAVKEYIEFYNHKRHHQALGYETPVRVYQSGEGVPVYITGHPMATSSGQSVSQQAQI